MHGQQKNEKLGWAPRGTTQAGERQVRRPAVSAAAGAQASGSSGGGAAAERPDTQQARLPQHSSPSLMSATRRAVVGEEGGGRAAWWGSSGHFLADAAAVCAACFRRALPSPLLSPANPPPRLARPPTCTAGCLQRLVLRLFQLAAENGNLLRQLGRVVQRLLQLLPKHHIIALGRSQLIWGWHHCLLLQRLQLS